MTKVDTASFMKTRQSYLIKQFHVNLKQTFTAEFNGQSFLQLAGTANSNKLVRFHSINSSADDSIYVCNDTSIW